MKVLFIEYPPCSTCKKAKNYLLAKGVEVQSRHIVHQTPTVEELRSWQKMCKLDLNKFFNTSGTVYKDLHLKDKIATMSEEEKLSLLASNGMLIKRPLLLYQEEVLLGFKEANYEKLCSQA